MIERAKQEGFVITMFFVYLNNVEPAIDRVALRVSKGGHNIPIDTMKRRFDKGLKKLFTYLKIVDNWYLLDNSLSDYTEIAKSIYSIKEINNFDIFNKIIGE
jgi:predicted ABC-type ATPase